eukprot:scaffold1640_cov161-Amphora_coffeaeformis.AAC.19
MQEWVGRQFRHDNGYFVGIGFQIGFEGCQITRVGPSKEFDAVGAQFVATTQFQCIQIRKAVHDGPTSLSCGVQFHVSPTCRLQGDIDGRHARRCQDDVIGRHTGPTPEGLPQLRPRIPIRRQGGRIMTACTSARASVLTDTTLMGAVALVAAAAACTSAGGNRPTAAGSGKSKRPSASSRPNSARNKNI